MIEVKVVEAPEHTEEEDVEIPIVGVVPEAVPVILKSSMVQRSLLLLFSNVIRTRNCEVLGKFVISTVEYPSVVLEPPPEGVNTVGLEAFENGTLAIPVPVE